MSAEEVRLHTRDGEELGAWFHPGAPGRATVLLFHGMGGSRASFAVHARRLADDGSGFLAVSLRSFGDSSGGALDFGWSARADVLAAVAFAEGAQPNVPRVVIGQSLGAVAAIFAAPELGARVAGYVLEAPYHDLVKACRDRLARYLPDPLVELAYLDLRLWTPCFAPTDLALVRPIDHVGRFESSVPVLFVAGERDDAAPVEDVRALARACSGTAEVVVLAGRDHQDLWTLDDAHWELWRSFLARVASR